MSSNKVKKSLPIVAIVGRPNVGKSTLFNAMSRTRFAIVADVEGVTRDRRIFAIRPIELNKREIQLMDTGGWMPESWRRQRKDKELLQAIEEQIIAGLQESAVILLVVDIRAGLTDLDLEIARFLRKQNKDFLVVCNKCDDSALESQTADFAELGVPEILAVSAEHRRGLNSLWNAVDERLPKLENPPSPEVAQYFSIKVCIVGRPNVGKSSFLNCLLQEKRVVENAMPGTTTDTVDIDVEKDGELFTLMDTAGIRRHAKRADDVENLSVMYAKRNLEKADLAFLVLDASDGVTSQDARIAELLYQSGCAAIIIANKWDLAPNHLHRNPKSALDDFVKHARAELPFLDYAPILAASAKERKIYGVRAGEDASTARALRVGSHIEDIWHTVKILVQARDRAIPSAELNDLIQNTLRFGPNIAQNVGKVFFAHRIPLRSPVFCAYVRNPQKIPDAYRRYLSRTIRETYGFRGNPIRWVFKFRRFIKQDKSAYQEFRTLKEGLDMKDSPF